MVRFIERAALTYICRFVALTLHACYRDSSRVTVPHCDNATVCSGGAFSWIVAKPSVAATSSLLLLLLLLPEQATLSADNKLILLPLIANTAGVAATCDNIGAQHALTPLVNVFDMSSIASFLPSVDLTITLHDTLTTLTGFLLLSLQWLRSTTSRLDFSLPNFGLNIYVECIEPEPPPSNPLQCWWWFWFYYYHSL